MTTYHDTLNRAAALLESNPTAWTTGANARDKNGGSVGPKSADACSWCAIGALRKVAFNNAELQNAARVLRGAVGMRIYKWNDSQNSRDEVTAMFRKLGGK